MWQMNQISDRVRSQFLRIKTSIRNIRMEIYGQVYTLKHDLDDM